MPSCATSGSFAVSEKNDFIDFRPLSPSLYSKTHLFVCLSVIAYISRSRGQTHMKPIPFDSELCPPVQRQGLLPFPRKTILSIFGPLSPSLYSKTHLFVCLSVIAYISRSRGQTHMKPIPFNSELCPPVQRQGLLPFFEKSILSIFGPLPHH